MPRTELAVEVLQQQSGREEEEAWSVASGYIIGPGLVLTAAHALTGIHCEIRLLDHSTYPGRVLLNASEYGVDLALVTAALPGSADSALRDCRFARVDRSEAQVLPDCVALGFPRYKEDASRTATGGSSPLRELEQLNGSIPTAAGARTTLLSFRVNSTPANVPTGAVGSAWEGVSGAAVFQRDPALGDSLLGVVAEHHSTEGLSTLSVVPIDALYDLPQEHRAAWLAALGIAGLQDLTSTPSGPRRSRARPPSVAMWTVPRVPLVQRAAEALLQQPSGMVALVGPPGFGKSIIARQVAQQVSDSQAEGNPFFPGGVLWLDVGQARDLRSVVAQGLAQLSGHSAGVPDLYSLAATFADELRASGTLLVLDDLWPSSELETVLAATDGLPLLATARNWRALPAVRVQEIPVGPMSVSESVALVTQVAPALQTHPRRELRKLTVVLGCWPLLLALAAAHLNRAIRRGATPSSAVDAVFSRFEAKGVTAFDVRHSDRSDSTSEANRTAGIAISMAASLDLLPHEDQARLQELAVFPPGSPIPIDIVTDYWQDRGLDRYESEDLLDGFADLYLLDLDRAAGAIRLHDLIHQYLLPADTKAMMQYHRELLNAWGDPFATTDPYKATWFTHHMKMADDAGLYSLIRPEWRDKVLALTGSLPSFQADVNRAAQLASGRGDLAREVEFRLISESLAGLSAEIPAEVLAAMLRVGQVDRALAYASRRDRVDRQRLLDWLVGHALTRSEDALDVAARGLDEDITIAALVQAARMTPVPARALELIREVASLRPGLSQPWRRVDVGIRVAGILSRVAPQRVSEVLEECARDMGGVSGGIEKAWALSSLPDILRLHPTLITAQDTLVQLVDLSRQLDGAQRGRHLARLAAAVGPVDRARAVQLIAEATQAVACEEYSFVRAGALADIVADLADFDSMIAEQVAGTVPELCNKAVALASIAAATARRDEGLSRRLLQRVEAMQASMSFEWDRDKAGAAMARAWARLDPRRAIEVCAGLGRDGPLGEDPQSDALSDVLALVAQQDGARATALAADLSGRTKARALARIASEVVAKDRSLASELVEQAHELSSALTRRSNYYRDSALRFAALTSSVNDAVASELVRHMRSQDRVEVLVMLGRRLAASSAITAAASVLAEAHDAALEMPDTGARAKALAVVAAALYSLPESFEEASRVAQLAVSTASESEPRAYLEVASELVLILGGWSEGAVDAAYDGLAASVQLALLGSLLHGVSDAVSGDLFAEAEQLARDVREPAAREYSLSLVGSYMAPAAPSRALRLAREIANPHVALDVYLSLVTSGAPEEAGGGTELLEEAARRCLALEQSPARDVGVAALASGIAVWNLKWAARLVPEVQDEGIRAELCARLAVLAMPVDEAEGVRQSQAAQNLLPQVPSLSRQLWLRASMLSVAAAAESPEVELLTQIKEGIEDLEDPKDRDEARFALAMSCVRLDLSTALACVAEIGDDFTRERAFASVCSEVAYCVSAEEAEDIALGASNARARALALYEVGMSAPTADADRIVRLANAIDDESASAPLLARLATRLVESDPQAARALAERALRLRYSAGIPASLRENVETIGCSLAVLGEITLPHQRRLLEEAQTVARGMGDPEQLVAFALVRMAELHCASDQERARALLARARGLTTMLPTRLHLLTVLIELHTHQGVNEARVRDEITHCAEWCRKLDDRDGLGGNALTDLARAVGTFDASLAREFLLRAGQQLGQGAWQHHRLADIVQVACEFDLELAEAFARRIQDGYYQALSLCQVAWGQLAHDPNRANALLREAQDSHRSEMLSSTCAAIRTWQRRWADELGLDLHGADRREVGGTTRPPDSGVGAASLADTLLISLRTAQDRPEAWTLASGLLELATHFQLPLLQRSALVRGFITASEW